MPGINSNSSRNPHDFHMIISVRIPPVTPIDFVCRCRGPGWPSNQEQGRRDRPRPGKEGGDQAAAAGGHAEVNTGHGDQDCVSMPLFYCWSRSILDRTSTQYRYLEHVTFAKTSKLWLIVGIDLVLILWLWHQYNSNWSTPLRVRPNRPRNKRGVGHPLRPPIQNPPEEDQLTDQLNLESMCFVISESCC